MGLFDGIGSALVSSGMNYLAGQQANKANQQANQANIAQSQQIANQIGNQTNPFSTIKTDGSGMTQTFAGTGADDALATRDIEAQSGLKGAIARKQLADNYTNPVPSYDASKLITQNNNNLLKNEFDKRFGDVSTIAARTGANTSNFADMFAKASTDFTNQNRLGDEDEAISRYLNGITNQSAAIGSLQSAAPKAPGFGGETNAAAALLAQKPTTQYQADYSGALLPTAGGNVMQTLAAQDAKTQDRALLDRILKSQGVL